MTDCVTILGTRGSVPVSGPEYAQYGGATTCVLVRLGGETVLIDAGTGLMALPEAAMELPELPLLLTHAHADHLLGLAVCPYVMRRGRRLDIYLKERGGMDGRTQIARMFSPPIWPVGLEELPAEVCVHPLDGSMTIGNIRIDTLEGTHPGGVSLLRLTSGGKSVAFMSDCTFSECDMPEYVGFARGGDLLLADGQYSPEEWEEHKDFGHSTWLMAARLAEDCGAGLARIIHHDPTHTDDMLDSAAPQLAALHPDCSFALAMEDIII